MEGSTPAPGDGTDVPADDVSVANGTELFRRVPPAHYKLENGRYVVRDGAFKNFPHPERKRMSVALGDTLEQAGDAPETVVHGMPEYGLVSVTAGFAREQDQRVERAPEEGFEAHGNVFGDKSASRRKQFAKEARWVAEPRTEDPATD